MLNFKRGDLVKRGDETRFIRDEDRMEPDLVVIPLEGGTHALWPRSECEPVPHKARYVVYPDSDSAHCCFEFTVFDTRSGSADNQPVCECFDKDSAERVAQALNLADNLERLAKEG